MIFDTIPRQLLSAILVIYTVEGFSKVDKHRCCNTTFVNAFPNAIREMCNGVLRKMIFSKTTLEGR